MQKRRLRSLLLIFLLFSVLCSAAFAASPLRILKQPEDAAGVVGEKIYFSITAEGDGLSYQWQYSKDGGRTWNMSSSTSDTATCTLASNRDGWLYRCIVIDSAGNAVTSSVARVTVESDLKITQQPKDASGKVGEKVFFTVAASGSGLSYQWQYSADNGMTWSMSSSTSDTAACTLSANRNGWLYRCIVIDRAGHSVTSDTARVTVVSALAITAQPKDASGVVGQKLTYSVAASGTGLNYRWQYSTDGGKTWIASSSTSSTATCTLASNRDGWLYRCIVSDQTGKSVTSATARVTVLPSVTQQPKDVSGKVGEQVRFAISATGRSLTYQWQYSTDGGKTWQKSSSTSTAATCTLSSAGRDGWLYRCVVKSSNGKSAVSSTAKVTVLPAITAQPKDASGSVGEQVRFLISATGKNLTYQWQYSTDGGKTWQKSSSTSTTATCTLSTASRDGWLYRCVITDAHGVRLVSSTARVSVTQPQSGLPEDLAQYPLRSSSVSESGVSTASFTYGSSVQGRDLIGWCIAPEHYSRTMLLNFEIHGWEDGYAADGQLLVDLGNAVVSHYAQASDLNGCRLIVIPSCNPDGLAEGTTNNGFGRCNADGIDLNRDFDADYQPYTAARNYTPYAFSGAESRALSALVLAANPEIVIDFHGWENCTIGNSDLAEVFSLCAGLNHRRVFTSAAHGYFAYWAEQQGAEGLLVEFKSPDTLNHDSVFQALDLLIAREYGAHSVRPADANYSALCPIKTYALSDERVYVQRRIGDTGTSYGYIDGTADQCEIVQVYADGWCKVRYPVSGYTKTGYCRLSEFVDLSAAVAPYTAHVSATESVWSKPDGAVKFGSVWSTDEITVVAVQDGMAQIIYPLDAGGCKMGWISLSALNGTNE